MKCYMCATVPSDSNTERVYALSLEAALKTARQNTSLEIVVLLDGDEDSAFHKICKKYNVSTIFHEFSHKQYLPRVYSNEWHKKTFDREIDYEKIAGTFMRFDIPFIEKEEDHVLYTDIDVLFLSDISEKDFNNIKWLAAAPEFYQDISEMTYFNAGIMYLNIKNMREISQKVFDKLIKGEQNSTGLFDQGYLNEFCFDSMDHLPLEMNWKPYWGYNSNAKIIHFHGLKPSGDNFSSGFAMSDKIFKICFKKNKENLVGFIIYLKKFYHILDKENDIWINDISKHIFNIILKDTFFTKLKKCFVR